MQLKNTIFDELFTGIKLKNINPGYKNYPYEKIGSYLISTFKDNFKSVS